MNDVIRLLECNPRIRILMSTRRQRRHDAVVAAVPTGIVIGADDLRLTAEEATRSVSRRLAGDAAPQMPAMFGGQTATTAIAIRNGLTHLDVDSLSAMHLDTLLSRLTTEERADLDALTIPTYAIRETLAVLCRDVDAALGNAEALGLLHWDYDQGRPVWSIADPARSLLLSWLTQADPLRSRALHAVTARAHAQHGYHFGAFEMAILARDYAFAAQLLDAFSDEPTRVHHRTVIDLLEGVGTQVLREHPALKLGLALTLAYRFEGLRSRSTALYQRATRQILRNVDRSRPTAHIIDLGRLANTYQVLGNFRRYRKMAERLMESVDTLESHVLMDAGVSVHAAMLRAAGSLLSAGDYDGAGKLAARLSSVAQDHSELFYSAVAVIALVAARAGRIREANRLLGSLDAMGVPATVKNGLRGYAAEVARALISLEQGDTNTAQRIIDDIHDVAARTPHWPLLAAVGALRALVDGDPQDGLTVLGRQVENAGRPAIAPAAARYLASVRALLFLADGRHGEALREIRHHGRTESGFGALYSFVSGSTEEALVRASAQLHRDDTTVTDQLLSAAVASAASRQLGATDAVVEYRRLAVSVSEENEYRSPLQWLPAASIEWLAEVIDVSPLKGDRSLFPLEERTQVVLTDREQAVIRAAVTCKNRSEIAQRLHVSENTVKSQLKSIYTKLGVNTREDAVVRAAELGLIAPESA